MTILSQLIEIIILKRRPQDIEFDQTAAAYYLILMIGFAYIMTAMSGQYSRPLLFSAVQYLAQAGVLFLFLRIANKQTRFIQSCTVFFGINALLSIPVLLFIVVPGLSVLWMFVAGWTFYISVLTMRDAFDASIFAAIFIYIAISITAVVISFVLLPEFQDEFLTLVKQLAEAK